MRQMRSRRMKATPRLPLRGVRRLFHTVRPFSLRDPDIASPPTGQLQAKSWPSGSQPERRAPRSTGASVESRLLNLPERDEALPRFIPKRQAWATEALQEIYPIEPAQRRIVPQHLRQAIVRNAAREMVHMMDADIRGEPAQRDRQSIIRAAERGFARVPAPIPDPMRRIELVLYEEQP